MIALHNLEIPYRFPQAVLQEAEEAGEVVAQGPRGLAATSR